MQFPGVGNPRILRLILPIAITLAPIVETGAETIAENTVGLSSNTFFPGNSMTTPLGGGWNTIIFNWFSDAPGTTPTAFGTLFLLTQDYLGTPQDLSSATPGFLAQSQSTSGGLYGFDPAVTLAPNTRYFFYANASGLLSGANDVPDENLYFTFSANTSWSINPADANYRLAGQVIPEPTIGILMMLGLPTLRLTRRSKRNA
jgi:hypothetical protein